MTFLLEVNVLIALLDPTHVHHDRAHAWFGSVGRTDWLSSPTTQNGVLRIVSHPRYSNTQPLAVVAESLLSLLSTGKHRFVADSLSLLGDLVERRRLLSSKQVTDTYLLATAVLHQARLATFDTKIVSTAVTHGAESIVQIP